MIALSVKQPYASQIASGKKKREYRTWATSHRGPMLVVASKSPVVEGLPAGEAVCVVDVVDVKAHQGGFAWVLENARPVVGFAVRGYAAHYHVEDGKIRYVGGGG